MFWIFLSLLPVGILGHGSLVDPPSRAAMHKYGFPGNPVDVNYNQGFCGGFGYQHSADIGGRYIILSYTSFSYRYLITVGVESVEILGVLLREIMKLQEANMQME